MKIIHILDHDPAFSNGLVNFVKDLSKKQSEEFEVLVISSADKNKVSKINKWEDGKVKFLITKNLKEVINLINEEDKLFFHVTSSLRYYTNRSKTILDVLNKNALFVFHVDPFYSELVGQRKNIEKIIEIVNETNSIGITFSSESIKMFKKLGLKKIKKVQMGVKIDEIVKSIKTTNKKRKYFITTSTGKGIYPYIKGVDRFVDIINALKLNKYSLNTGYSEYLSIKNKYLSRKEFLDLLLSSKAFIQLSRSELYGIAIIEAKLLKTPVIVSDVGGLKDNVKYGFRVNSNEEVIEILKDIIKGEDYIKEIVEKNFKDSIKRETIDNTWRDIKNILKEIY